MKHDYNKILQELKALKTTEEKIVFIQNLIKEIQLSDQNIYSYTPSSKIDHLNQKISYLEDFFALRNIIVGIYLSE